MLDEDPEEVISLGLGNKLYEMSNHLGNVLTVINDIKVPQSSNSVDVDGYLATIVSTADYSPFGVQLDGRTVSASSYRYGFQGQEKDDEIKGAGNSVNYTFRMHDTRLGRFFAVDPLAACYPYWTPYQFSGNSVIGKMELEGLEPKDPAGKEFSDAKKIVEDWAKKGENGGVTNCTVMKNAIDSKTELVNQLMNRLNNPEMTNQGNTWLCGPASAVNVLINHDPEGYVKTVISLYENGKANLGGKTLKLSSTQFNASFDSNGKHEGLLAIDYILFGAVRSTFNNGLVGSKNFEVSNGKPIDQGTFPIEYKKILKAFGLSSEYSSVRGKINVQKINDAINGSGNWVVIFDNHGISHDSPDKGFWGVAGIHFIVVHGFTISGNSITVKFWDYGSFNDYSGNPKETTMSKGEFQKFSKGAWVVSK